VAPVDPQDGGQAGGVFTSNTNLTMTGSTISGNTVSGGTSGSHGGLYLAGGSPTSPAIVNTTISGNTVAAGAGVRTTGALAASFPVTLALIHSTVSGNTAPDGIAIAGGAQVTAQGSLIDQGATACFQPLIADAYNIESGISCLGNAADTDVVNAAINVGALNANGGPTLTQSFGPASPALDLVPAASCLNQLGGALATDQRGAERPFGANCDAGAYERVTCGGDLPLILGGPAGETLTGNPFADAIAGSGGNDTIDGADGADKLCGGSGADQITGSGGADQIFGDAGNDAVFSLDTVAETVDCGPGQDTATIDLALDTAVDCETIANAPQLCPPSLPACGGGTPPKKPRCKKGQKLKRVKVKGKKKKKKLKCVKKKKKKRKK
jgi:Ca2+-binding RTX toxin-like protein